MKVFFQIGTNNGNDNFRKLVIDNKPDLVILVEPNLNLYNDIKKNYENIPNVVIYSNAIYYENDKEINLYIPNKRGYDTPHFSLVPMNNWGSSKSELITITSKSITFDKICENHNIVEIEYLQIDTEGFDSEIIKMINFNKYKINTIRYEKWGFASKEFILHNNDKASDLGIKGMKTAYDKLIKHNYVISEIQDSDGNDIIAKLKK